MSSLTITPSILDFGVITENYRPTAVNFTIKNETNDDLQINFGSISSDSMWFTHIDSVVEEQRKLGFDIFYMFEKITNLKLYSQEEQYLSLVIIPESCSITFCSRFSVPFMVFKDDDEVDTESEKYFDIFINSVMSDTSFKITPQHLFLNECSQFQPQTKSFQIKNLSNVELPILIYPDESLEIKTPDFPNFLLLKPKSVETLTLNHIPKEIGQFDRKIIFECMLNQHSEPHIMRVNSSVSPAEVPADFPVITPLKAEIDFGEVNAGIPVESSFMITNHGDKTYSVCIAGVIDTFAPSHHHISNSYDFSNSQVVSNNSNFQLLFKNGMSLKSEHKIDMALRPHSAATIYATYIPSFHLSADSSTFEHRTFIITLTFTDKSSKNIYYRRIKCKAAICHSTISISPSLIEFGDTIVGQTDKSAEVTIFNHSPLPTSVRISTSSRSLTVPSIPVEIDGNSSYNFRFKFYPRKVNPDYTASIKFVNQNNTSNELQLGISAIIVANSSESIHSMCYNILCDGSHISAFNFNNCPINYPSLKSFVIKNRTNNSLTISLSSSTPEISFYQEEATPILCSSSNGNLSSSSITNHSNLSENPQLIEPDRQHMLNEIEMSMKVNSDFFMNQFTLLSKYSEQEIINHFKTVYSQLMDMIKKETVVNNLYNKSITIPAHFKMEVFILLIPRIKNGIPPLFWKHREEKMFINLLGQSSDVEPRSIPVLFNVAQSKFFLSSYNLNFGNILCNTRYQNKLYLSNESALPFLFELESDKITFDKQPYGIGFPIGSYSIPCSFVPKIDGKFNEKVIIHNILNPEEKHSVTFKGVVSRRSNFFIDPLSLDFGDIVATSSSKRLLLFITNTSTEENELTLSHLQKETLFCKPLISYQFKILNSRRLSESNRLQIEKLGCKLRCLQRKKKAEYAEKIQRLIDNLSNTTVENTPAQLKQMDAKYMDCFTFRAAPLQMVCIELQLIPSILTGKRISKTIPLEGSILIYENKRSVTQKMIHYKANLLPVAQRLLDSVIQKSLVVEPLTIVLNNVKVHECTRTHVTIKNISNTLQNYWISSDSSDNCIISSPKGEGSIKTQETLELAIDVYSLCPGKITKTITLTTQTSAQTITLEIESEYKPVLSFQSLPSDHHIDFGNISLTSLQVIEERKSFGICNTSNSTLYISILNDHQKEIIVYEKDPRVPQINAFALTPGQLINVNILLQPEIDPIPYQKYVTTLISGKLTIKAYESLEEAQSSVLPSMYSTDIYINAAVGRIGIFCSEQSIDLGMISKKVSYDYKILVKNRSTHIPLEIITSCTQGLLCSPSSFSLQGHKVSKTPQEITLHFQSNSEGINQAKLIFTVVGSSVQYSKTINITSFVDPLVLETDLPKDSKQIDVLNIGQLYVINDVPVPKKSKIKFTNKSNMILSFEINGKRMTIAAGKFQTFPFTFPFQNDFYDPETPKFSYRMQCRSLKTQRILKIIDIVGEFVESFGELSTDFLNLGRFGKVNNWQYNENNLIIFNKSNIPLALSVESDSDLVEYPKQIELIPANSEYLFEIVPSIKKLINLQGEQNISMKFINQNNPNNVMKLKILFDIIDSFLLFENIISEDGILYVKTSEFKTIKDSDDTTNTYSNAWFQITNQLNDEFNIEIHTEKLVSEIDTIELYMRKTEIKIDSLDLQPNEKVEVRVKITASQISSEEPNKVLAKIYFKVFGQIISTLNVI